MHLWLRILKILLCLLNVFFHTVGSYALVSLYSKCRHKSQRIYILNLSLSEAIINFIEIILTILEFFCAEPRVTSMIKYLRIISFTGVSFVYYIGMTLLTLDRLAKIVLGLIYPQYWNKNRTKRVVLGTWFIGILITIAVCLAFRYLNFNWEDAFYKFFYLTVGFLFIVIAFVAYILIFRKYSRSTRKMSNISALGIPGEPIVNSQYSKLLDFKKSMFFIPAMLISTFFVFMVIPDLIQLFVGIIDGNTSEELNAACFISYALSLIHISEPTRPY